MSFSNIIIIKNYSVVLDIPAIYTREQKNGPRVKEGNK